MKLFFDKLYYKYYKFQVRVGNRDLAPLTSLLIIVISLMLYYGGLFLLLVFVFPKLMLPINDDFFKRFGVALNVALIIFFSYFYLYTKRYKRIIAEYDNRNISNLIAILFPLIGFILFNIGWILKMLQNQGKI